MIQHPFTMFFVVNLQQSYLDQACSVSLGMIDDRSRTHSLHDFLSLPLQCGAARSHPAVPVAQLSWKSARAGRPHVRAALKKVQKATAHFSLVHNNPAHHHRGGRLEGSAGFRKGMKLTPQQHDILEQAFQATPVPEMHMKYKLMTGEEQGVLPASQGPAEVNAGPVRNASAPHGSAQNPTSSCLLSSSTGAGACCRTLCQVE